MTQWNQGVAKVDGVEYAAGTPFLQAVNERAHERGLAAFRVFKNGTEITGPNMAPATLTADDTITIQPYDKAGGIAFKDEDDTIYWLLQCSKVPGHVMRRGPEDEEETLPDGDGAPTA